MKDKTRSEYSESDNATIRRNYEHRKTDLETKPQFLNALESNANHISNVESNSDLSLNAANSYENNILNEYDTNCSTALTNYVSDKDDNNSLEEFATNYPVTNITKSSDESEMKFEGSENKRPVIQNVQEETKAFGQENERYQQEKLEMIPQNIQHEIYDEIHHLDKKEKMEIDDKNDCVDIYEAISSTYGSSLEIEKKSALDDEIREIRAAKEKENIGNDKIPANTILAETDKLEFDSRSDATLETVIKPTENNIRTGIYAEKKSDTDDGKYEFKEHLNEIHREYGKHQGDDLHEFRFENQNVEPNFNNTSELYEQNESDVTKHYDGHKAELSEEKLRVLAHKSDELNRIKVNENEEFSHEIEDKTEFVSEGNIIFDKMAEKKEQNQINTSFMDENISTEENKPHFLEKKDKWNLITETEDESSFNYKKDNELDPSSNQRNLPEFLGILRIENEITNKELESNMWVKKDYGSYASAHIVSEDAFMRKDKPDNFKNGSIKPKEETLLHEFNYQEENNKSDIWKKKELEATMKENESDIKIRHREKEKWEIEVQYNQPDQPDLEVYYNEKLTENITSRVSKPFSVPVENTMKEESFEEFNKEMPEKAKEVIKKTPETISNGVNVEISKTITDEVSKKTPRILEEAVKKITNEAIKISNGTIKNFTEEIAEKVIGQAVEYPPIEPAKGVNNESKKEITDGTIETAQESTQKVIKNSVERAPEESVKEIIDEDLEETASFNVRNSFQLQSTADDKEQLFVTSSSIMVIEDDENSMQNISYQIESDESVDNERVEKESFEKAKILIEEVTDNIGLMEKRKNDEVLGNISISQENTPYEDKKWNDLMQPNLSEEFKAQHCPHDSDEQMEVSTLNNAIEKEMENRNVLEIKEILVERTIPDVQENLVEVPKSEFEETFLRKDLENENELNKKDSDFHGKEDSIKETICEGVAKKEDEEVLEKLYYCEFMDESNDTMDTTIFHEHVAYKKFFAPSYNGENIDEVESSSPTDYNITKDKTKPKCEQEKAPIVEKHSVDVGEERNSDLDPHMVYSISDKNVNQLSLDQLDQLSFEISSDHDELYRKHESTTHAESPATFSNSKGDIANDKNLRNDEIVNSPLKGESGDLKKFFSQEYISFSGAAFSTNRDDFSIV